MKWADRPKAGYMKRDKARRDHAALSAALLAAAVFSAAFPSFSASQTPAPERPIIPRLTEAPKIDGRLDNPLWETQALRIDDFSQLSPKAGEPGTQKTVAYLGMDDKNLYVAFRAFDSDPGKIRCSITNRDNAIDDDWVTIFLDTFNEKRRAFCFLINPAGVQMDMIRTEEGGNDNMDSSWDTVFASEGKVDAEGYTVEMAIPFKSLRFPDKPEKVWTIVLGRNLPRQGEVDLWPKFDRNIPDLLTQGREFVIPGHIEKGKNLEIMPIATSLQKEGHKLDLQPGVNLKYGLHSDLTLDLTANPDFSQIEADVPQIDVNLRYALRYAEKRPFFMEGMELFNYPDIEMVYTRRIIDPLWGAKVSGKIGRTAYGILSAYDLHPSESLWDIHGGETNGNERALFNIVRLRTDVFKESYLGFSVADKEIDGSWNRVAGADGQLKFANKFFLSFQAIASKTSYDGDKTSLAPALYGEAFYFNKHWNFGGYFEAIHPEFEASSGFVNRTDYRSGGMFSSLTLYPDKPYLNQVRFQLQGGQRDSYFGSTVQDQWGRFHLQLRFTEFNQMDIVLERALERYTDVNFRRTDLSIQAQTNIIGWMPFGFYFMTGDSINYDPDDAYLGYSNQYGLTASFKPSPRLTLGIDFSKETFWRKWGGAWLWDYNVIRLKTTYQVSKPLSVRAILDYNHYYKEIYGSFLFSWVLKPGTVFFLGFDNDYLRDGFGRYDRQNYNVFVKFSYWWRT
jgi:hypothetical protein